MGEDSGSGGGGGAKLRKLWLGLHGAADIHWFSSAKDVCTLQSVGADKYNCYVNGDGVFAQQLPNMAGNSGSITGGPQLATMRLLVSGDYAVMPNLTVGGRLGFAFRGGPKDVKYSKDSTTDPAYLPSYGKAFLPIHAEARLSWWFKSLGQPGIHPYVAVGGGLAQVDAKVSVPVRQCTGTTDAATIVEPTTCPAANWGPQYKMDAYKRLGIGFVNIAPGAVFPLSSNLGVQANINVMYMLPVSGLVIEPSLGLVVGL
jgi:hypothetical protein